MQSAGRSPRPLRTQRGHGPFQALGQILPLILLARPCPCRTPPSPEGASQTAKLEPSGQCFSEMASKKGQLHTAASRCRGEPPAA
jgi:hypothetical protein